MGILSKLYARIIRSRMILPIDKSLLEPFCTRLNELKLNIEEIRDNHDGTVSLCYFATDTENENIDHLTVLLKAIKGIQD